MLGDERFDLLAGEGGEDLDITFGVIVGDVHPELEELIRGCIFLREPNVAGLGLTELTAVSFGNQRTCQGVRLVAGDLLDELGTGGDIAPLIRATHLEFAVLMLVEVHEIVALEELIGELGERHTLRELAVETLLDGVLRHHIVDGDEFADVAREIKEGVVLHPVVVIDQLGSVGFIGIEIQEVLQLLADTLHVMAEGLLGQEVTLGRLAGRVTDHTRCAAQESDGFMAAGLQVTQHHDAAQVADMETIRRGVDTHVGGRHFFHQLFFRTGHDILEHASPTELFYEILCHIIVINFLFKTFAGAKVLLFFEICK